MEQRKQLEGASATKPSADAVGTHPVIAGSAGPQLPAITGVLHLARSVSFNEEELVEVMSAAPASPAKEADQGTKQVLGTLFIQPRRNSAAHHARPLPPVDTWRVAPVPGGLQQAPPQPQHRSQARTSRTTGAQLYSLLRLTVYPQCVGPLHARLSLRGPVISLTQGVRARRRAWRDLDNQHGQRCYSSTRRSVAVLGRTADLTSGRLGWLAGVKGFGMFLGERAFPCSMRHVCISLI